MAEAEDEYYNSKVVQFGHVVTIIKWGTIVSILTALLVMNVID